MAWTIEYSRTVRKFLEKSDPQTRRQIRNFCEVRVATLGDPRSFGKALKGPLGGFWSYRSGNIRIICDIQDSRLVVLVVLVVVVAVGNRRDVYK